jgi:hypothetical protein
VSVDLKAGRNRDRNMKFWQCAVNLSCPMQGWIALPYASSIQIVYHAARVVDALSSLYCVYAHQGGVTGRFRDPHSLRNSARLQGHIRSSNIYIMYSSSFRRR